MGLINYGIPQNLALAAKQQFGIRNFVETGTFRGATAAFAAPHFEHVYTVEFVEQRYLSTRESLKVHANITCLHGNSSEALRAIAPKLHGIPTMFWLDAHWNGDGESREFECPVADELKAINNADLDAFILVDDARYFLAPPPVPCNPDAWPTLSQLVPLLAYSDRFVVMVDDAIIAWPSRAKQFLIEYTRSRPSAWSPAAPAGSVFYVARKDLPPITLMS